MILTPLTDSQRRGNRWFYRQINGDIWSLESYGKNPVLLGYSGFKNGKNNPDMQNVHDIGPIPLGFWHIGNAHNSLHTGPVLFNKYQEYCDKTGHPPVDYLKFFKLMLQSLGAIQ